MSLSGLNDELAQVRTKKKEYYPDVVDLITFRKMLGGISDCAARRLMKKNRVKLFYITNPYWVPKVWAIQYLTSGKYQEDIAYRYDHI